MSEAEPVDAPAVRWGLGDAVLSLAVGLVVGAIVAAAVTAATGRTEGLGYTIAGLVGLWVGLAGVPVIASRRKGTGSLAEDYGLRFGGWGDVAAGMLVGCAGQALLVPLIVSLFSAFLRHVDVAQQTKNVTGNPHGLGLAVLAPFLVVGAPVVEELFFRGLLQRSLARRLGPVPAVVGAAVVFGLVHAQPNMSGASELALITALGSFGAVLGVLAQRTGRLGPGLAAHATFNLITVLYLAR